MTTTEAYQLIWSRTSLGDWFSTTAIFLDLEKAKIQAYSLLMNSKNHWKRQPAKPWLWKDECLFRWHMSPNHLRDGAKLEIKKISFNPIVKWGGPYGV